MKAGITTLAIEIGVLAALMRFAPGLARSAMLEPSAMVHSPPVTASAITVQADGSLSDAKVMPERARRSMADGRIGCRHTDDNSGATMRTNIQ
jgi:hypothetical protein